MTQGRKAEAEAEVARLLERLPPYPKQVRLSDLPADEQAAMARVRRDGGWRELVGILTAVLLADRVGRIRLQIVGFIGCAAGLALATCRCIRRNRCAPRCCSQASCCSTS